MAEFIVAIDRITDYAVQAEDEGYRCPGLPR